MKRAARAALLAFCLALGSRPADASERLGEILAAMKEAGDRLRTLTARFEQTNHDHILGEKTTTAGKLYLQVPGRIRWEYDLPDGKVVLVKGDKLFLYTPSARQVHEFPRGQMRGAEGDLLIGFGGSNRELGKRYQVNVLKEEGSQVLLKLVPMRETPSAMFTAIELTVDKTRWLPARTRFFELNEDTTELIFKQLQVNGALPRQIFELKLPPGVEFLRGSDSHPPRPGSKRAFSPPKWPSHWPELDLPP